ncbi:hypothetical protein F2Q68_00040209 [Brassica cretica]|uniref:Uncharacterized protein n=1 Tax=Brassica cretica TaxID=69181 RepID=A0A8S9MJE8_BRACR|nr:hypothetical protein F2Q68_00040209 [Brassica cretica]
MPRRWRRRLDFPRDSSSVVGFGHSEEGEERTQRRQSHRSSLTEKTREGVVSFDRSNGGEERTRRRQSRRSFDRL